MSRWCVSASQEPTAKGDIDTGGSERPGRDVLGPQVGVIEATTHPASGDYRHRVRRVNDRPIPPRCHPGAPSYSRQTAKMVRA